MTVLSRPPRLLDLHEAKFLNTYVEDGSHLSSQPVRTCRRLDSYSQRTDSSSRGFPSSTTQLSVTFYIGSQTVLAYRDNIFNDVYRPGNTHKVFVPKNFKKQESNFIKDHKKCLIS
jgi:hypothetical protein